MSGPWLNVMWCTLLQILTNQGQLYNAIGILGATCECSPRRVFISRPTWDVCCPLHPCSVTYDMVARAGMPHNLFLGTSIIQV